jgi:F-type H+-transporting ATPase subunit gamma
MAQTREISRRIKSVGNTKKMTKAMEMVAAAKTRKAVESVLKTRAFSNLSWETVVYLANLSLQREEPMHPLLAKRPKIGRVAVVVITSNRGLCGGYNSALLAKVRDSLKVHDHPTDFILLGKKGVALVKQGYEVAAEFIKEDSVEKIDDIRPLVGMAIDSFLKGKYDRVMVAYTDFVSASKQIPRIKQLLPVQIDQGDQYLGVIGPDQTIGLTKQMAEAKQASHLTKEGFVHDFIFEPSEKEVMDRIVSRLIEMQLFQAVLEANASEHSARMMAMHQATDAADEMVEKLTLYYNKARQAGITAEIAEISAGANALAE